MSRFYEWKCSAIYLIWHSMLPVLWHSPSHVMALWRINCYYKILYLWMNLRKWANTAPAQWSWNDKIKGQLRRTFRHLVHIKGHFTHMQNRYICSCLLIYQIVHEFISYICAFFSSWHSNVMVYENAITIAFIVYHLKYSGYSSSAVDSMCLPGRVRFECRLW